MQKKILESINDCIRAVQQLKEPHALAFINAASKALSDCFQRGGKVIIAGNGGSLCDASHFAEELTGYFRKSRRALPAIPLSEPGHLTCTANDRGFEWVFARGVEAYGKAGDIFIGLTTSGNSPNIIKAFEQAKEQGLHTIAFLGKGGGKIRGTADLELIIEEFITSDRVQEAHMAAIHLIIEQIEEHLFYGVDCERGEEKVLVGMNLK
ncbi:MAG: SIS domain-containing protein [Candidatus Protochlamydia sp.]|nr:SIS domain-containing protein [Candidatus Protochlamydia sp.]